MINDLPTELLAHIFFIGSFADDDSDDEGDDVGCVHDLMEWSATVRDFPASDGDVDVDDDDDDGDMDGSRASSASPHFEVELELPFQVLVSHVCRRWREVAVDSPVLWTSIDFSEGPPFEKTQIWIERSKALPLNIEVDCTLDDDAEEQDAVPFFSYIDLGSILDIITPHVHRWQSLEVSVSVYPYMHLVISRLAECDAAPQLKSLHLYHYEDCDEQELFHLQNLKHFMMPFHGNAPNLSHITLWGVHIHWSTPFLNDIASLELCYHARDVRPTWDEFSRMIQSSPNLESLSLCLSGPVDLPADSQEDPLEIPSLVNLTLAYHEPSYISPLMRSISLPNLKTLDLDFDSADYSTFARQLATPPSAKSRSLLAGLEQLKIGGLPSDLKTCEFMYEQLANLKLINLNCTFIDYCFFENLMKPLSTSSGIQVYCPNLETIKTTGVDGKAMRELVEIRVLFGFPIKRVFMSEEDELEERDEKWLRQHVSHFGYFEPSDTEDETDEEDVEEIA